MTVVIDIHYVSAENKVLQRGSFPLKKRKPEEVAYEFWRWIKREHPYECLMEKVICDGEEITEKVKELEKAPLD